MNSGGVRPFPPPALGRLLGLPHLVVPESAGETRLTTMALMISQRCNLNCVYCYGGNGTHGHASEMSEPTARAAVDWLLEQAGPERSLDLVFFGGEPLLNLPVLEATVAHAERRAAESGKRFDLSVTTNATLITDRFLDYCLDHRIRLSLSIDGDVAVQDEQRPFRDGRGSFAVVAPIVRKVLARMPDTLCRATLIDPARYQEIDAALHRLGFRHRFLALVTPPAGGADRFARDADQIRRVLDGFAEEIRKLIRTRDFATLAARRFRRAGRCGRRAGEERARGMGEMHALDAERHETGAHLVRIRAGHDGAARVHLVGRREQPPEVPRRDLV